MVEITLKNGSKFQIAEMNFKGKLIDSNGVEPGGITTFPFTESDVNKLNAQVPIQMIYNGMFGSETESENATEFAATGQDGISQPEIESAETEHVE
jgi:hypothetical protein